MDGVTQSSLSAGGAFILLSPAPAQAMPNYTLYQTSLGAFRPFSLRNLDGYGALEGFIENAFPEATMVWMPIQSKSSTEGLAQAEIRGGSDGIVRGIVVPFGLENGQLEVPKSIISTKDAQ
jgi:hypothetical protein